MNIQSPTQPQSMKEPQESFQSYDTSSHGPMTDKDIIFSSQTGTEDRIDDIHLAVPKKLESKKLDAGNFVQPSQNSSASKSQTP